MITPPNYIALWILVPLLAIVAFTPAVGCANGNGETKTITVFAAASLTDAFEEISRKFESENPGVEVKLNLAGSQRLRSQLELGAEADVFASADELQMSLATDAGLIEGAGQHFASTSMAIIAAKDSGVVNLKDLAKLGTKVVIAHEGVPAGQYSLQLLDLLSSDESELEANYAERVLANVVSKETSVKFVEQKVVLGQADAGILYRPGVLTGTASGAARELPLPPIAQEVRAHYPIAAISDSTEVDTARDFVDFVMSNQAQSVLASHGFDPP